MPSQRRAPRSRIARRDARASPALLALHPASSRRAPASCCAESAPFSARIEDTRLALEVAVIHTWRAVSSRLLQRRDPLSERVHLGKAAFAGLRAAWSVIWRHAGRVGRRPGRRMNRRMREHRGRWQSAPDTAAAAERASGSSFYTAMRILPRAQREAMFEIYSFCRAVDDIADSQRAARRCGVEQLAALARRHRRALRGQRRCRARAGLAAPVADFDLRREDFHAVIDGMEMDVVADIRAPDCATLDLYCDRVASAVGRLSVRVFGMEEKAGIALAHHLGRALQLTNILRDIDEDAAIGRLYLPREALARGRHR